MYSSMLYDFQETWRWLEILFRLPSQLGALQVGQDPNMYTGPKAFLQFPMCVTKNKWASFMPIAGPSWRFFPMFQHPPIHIPPSSSSHLNQPWGFTSRLIWLWNLQWHWISQLWTLSYFSLWVQPRTWSQGLLLRIRLLLTGQEICIWADP